MTMWRRWIVDLNSSMGSLRGLRDDEVEPRMVVPYGMVVVETAIVGTACSGGWR
jgi:hypothetical protein